MRTRLVTAILLAVTLLAALAGPRPAAAFVTCANQPVTITGAGVIAGTPGDDVVHGGDDDDSLLGGDGDDSLDPLEHVPLMRSGAFVHSVTPLP